MIDFLLILMHEIDTIGSQNKYVNNWLNSIFQSVDQFNFQTLTDKKIGLVSLQYDISLRVIHVRVKAVSMKSSPRVDRKGK